MTNTIPYKLLFVAASIEDTGLRKRLVKSAYITRRAGLGGTLMDIGQVALDAAGFVPGWGEIADGINSLVSLTRGDYFNALMSLISMIPEAGDVVGKGGKVLKFVAKLAEESGNFQKAAKFVLKYGAYVKTALKALVTFIQENTDVIEEYITSLSHIADGKISADAPDKMKALAAKVAKVPKLQEIVKKSAPNIGMMGKEVKSLSAQAEKALKFINGTEKQIAAKKAA